MTFTLPYPKDRKGFSKRFGLNAIYAGKHWSLRKKDSDYWHRLVHNELLRQGVRKNLYQKPVVITFYWNDRLDCSNHAYMGKMIEDALKGWVISDDSRKYVRGICHTFYDKPYITVEIKEDIWTKT